LKIISILGFIIVFWALFDQHASSWIEQAKMMDLSLHDIDQTLSFQIPLVGWTFKPLPSKVLPNEIQAANPLLVMVLIPLLNLIYLGCDRLGIRTPPLRRITVGMVVTASSFVAAALIQAQIDRRGAGQLWFVWQLIPYILLTVGEVMVSITAFSLGNVLVALLAYFSGLSLINFFGVFAGCMAGAAFLFGIRSRFYVQKDYTQG